GAAACLATSSLPVQGYLASVRVAKVDGQLLAFPTSDQLDESELDLIISGSEKSILMIEGFAQEMPEAEMAEAIVFAHGVVREIIGLVKDLAQRVQPAPSTYVAPPSDGLLDRLKASYFDRFRTA